MTQLIPLNPIELAPHVALGDRIAKINATADAEHQRQQDIQMNAIQLAEAQRKAKEAAGYNSAVAQGGTPDEITDRVSQVGAGAFTDWTEHLKKMNTEELAQTKSRMDLVKFHTDQMSKIADNILSLPAEQRAQVWQQSVQTLKTSGDPLLSQLPDHYDENYIRQFGDVNKQLETQSKQLDMQIKRDSEVRAKAEETRKQAEEARKVAEVGQTTDTKNFDAYVKDRMNADGIDPSTLNRKTEAEYRNKVRTDYEATKRASTMSSVEQQEMNDWITKNPGKGPADFMAYKSSLGKTEASQDDIKSAAEGIASGELSPDMSKSVSYKDRTAVSAALKRMGFNQALALQDYNAIQHHLSTLNGAQQERLRQAISFTSETLPQLEDAYNEWKKQAGSSGFKVLNKASLASMKQLPGAAGSAATQLDALIGDFTSELGTVYKGGNASTDESLKLAATNLSGDWNEQTFTDAIKRLKTSIQIRNNSIKNSTTQGVSSTSPYQPKPEDQAAPTTTPKTTTTTTPPGKWKVIR